MRKLGLIIGALCALVLIGSTFAADVTLLTGQNAKLGTFLTDSKGMTLYTFKKDATGVSNCAGPCAAAWPPLTTTGSATLPSGVSGTLATISRADGTTQVTFNGMPLYYYAKDTSAGQTNGQGVGNLWFVVALQNAPTALPATGGIPLIPALLLGLGLAGTGAWFRRR